MIAAKRLPQLALLVLMSAGFASTQLGKAPSVSMAPVATVTAPQAKQTVVPLSFRVTSGFHINSNTPKSEFLIPTALRISPPTDLAITKLTYPAGKDMSFPFAPDEPLNVYSGDFTVTMKVRPLHTVMPGKYAIHGELKYQACDNAACYPPKKLPVDFEVKVLKGATVS